ncbi:transcriptional regulator, TetR family [Aeromicrobium marinum DSM 15272]|uniref:Transcriptional regulator, TetR family n=1 Tax=Aeromicrobium marinum DSM 15272 TaxID=585531 RepID=E2SCQ2_9ACTN|nr:TetR/AcrR family transcriptional regulator [Aeromicrobium marinum]EFQ83005.1 transcriptional regulator, TetR family [Aeromicrobium marinum DSM 15272]
MSHRSGHPDRRSRAAHLGPVARRPLVLDAALAVWDRHGYAGATTAAIAEEAGVSKPVLYECYSTKDAILFALLDREEERLMAAVAAAVPSAIDPEHPEHTFRQMYVTFFTAVLGDPMSWRVFLDAGRTVPRALQQRVAEGREVSVAGIAALLDTFTVEQGRPMSPRELHLRAELLVTLVEKNALLLLSQEPGPDAWTVEDLAEVTTRIALQGWA